jgi:thimet oligopeptidase
VKIRPWNTPVWSPEVTAHEIVENGRTIGRFYLDMHPRKDKFSHAALFPVRIGTKDRALPVGALVTNLPTGLMEHRQVEIFLHEFGHLLHWLFSGERELAIQNFVELEPDVTEAPSTLLEAWVWDYDTLKGFATNEAGEPIPAALVEKMNVARHFGRGGNAMGMLGLSAAALDFHTNDLKDADLTSAFNQSYDRYALVPNPPGSHYQSSFLHLTAYGASYYTYQWSEALAADLLSRFRKDGLRNQTTAKPYRDLILALGGSDSMNVLVRKFLGRDWSTDSFRRELEGS